MMIAWKPDLTARCLIPAAATIRFRTLPRAGAAYRFASSPAGYYRSVFQSRDYTTTAFAAKLEVRGYLIAGFGYQHLIVLQKA
jgi:hypothetical protein